MNAIATRYAIHLAVLGLCALIPVGVHTYADVRHDDCLAPGAFISRSLTGESKLRRDAWMRRKFDAFAWREGTIRAPDVEPGVPSPSLRWSIVRTYDAKRVYHRAERAFLRGASVVRTPVEWTDTPEGPLPVHRPVFEERLQRRMVPFASYLLVYRGEPITNPYLAQLRAAARLVFRGAAPMTLMVASGEVPRERLATARASADEWLTRAWRDYRLTCLGSENR